MKKAFSVALFGLIVGAASIVQAVPISLTNIDGDWQNATPASNADIVNSGTNGGISTASWGASGVFSSYVFVSGATPKVVESDGAIFQIGTFTHNNFPIPSGTSITAIDLLLGIEAFGLVDLSATFNYTHNETPNIGDAKNQRDIVTITNPILNAEFDYGGNTFYFNLVGFSQDGGANVASIFKTYENYSNVAGLYARVTSSPIPEPTTMLLFGAGLAGLAAVGRRRK